MKKKPPSRIWSYIVKQTFDHDSKAFTQGLQIIDGELYEGTGLYGKSSLRKVDLGTGKVIKQLDLSSEYFGEGITVLGDKIYQITWQNKIGFVYNRTTWDVIRKWQYNTEGWGLTTDGIRLIMSDGTSIIRFYDPESLAEIGRITVKDHGKALARLNELEYIEGEIFANVFLTDQIAIISAETGDVNGWIDMVGLRLPKSDVLNGIAYDKKQRSCILRENCGRICLRLSWYKNLKKRNQPPDQKLVENGAYLQSYSI